MSVRLGEDHLDFEVERHPWVLLQEGAAQAFSLAVMLRPPAPPYSDADKS